MWIYEKRLQFPVNVKKRDLKMAKLIFETLGGASGELSASMEYLQQRYTMPIPEAIALLTDIGTEELAHLEILSSLVYQKTKCKMIVFLYYKRKKTEEDDDFHPLLPLNDGKFIAISIKPFKSNVPTLLTSILNFLSCMTKSLFNSAPSHFPFSASLISNDNISSDISA